jgi:hypothetical protein
MMVFSRSLSLKQDPRKYPYRRVECVREDDDVATKKLQGGPVPGMPHTVAKVRALGPLGSLGTRYAP